MHTGKKNHGEGLVWEKGITQRQANLFFIRVKDNRETQLVGPQLKFEMEVFFNSFDQLWKYSDFFAMT